MMTSRSTAFVSASARHRSRTLLAAACLLLALAACAAFAQLATPAAAHAATKAEVVAKCETLGLPDHLVRIGKNVAKTVSFDAATGDLIMADIARGEALLSGRSIHDLDTDESVQLIGLCASSLARVGISASYEFNPNGGADITLYAADSSVIAKFNTMYDEVKRTGGNPTAPSYPSRSYALPPVRDMRYSHLRGRRNRWRTSPKRCNAESRFCR